MVTGKTERRAPVFAPPASEIPARLAALEKENHELKEALRNKPPIWSGISHDPLRRRAIIDRSGLVQKIELPKAVQRDLAWHTEGRMGAVDAAFNPSIFDAKDGRTWMLYRCECVPWFRYSKIAIVELDALFCPIPSTNQMLDLPTDWDGYNAEDPRFIAQAGDRVWIAYNDGLRQYVAELTMDGWKVGRSAKIDTCQNLILSEKEKNWTFTLLEDGKPARFKVIYSLHPWIEIEVVVGDSGAHARHVRTHHWDCPWKQGQIRGGAGWVPFDGRQALAFHSSIKIADNLHGPVRQYFAGLLTSDGTRVNSMTVDPLIMGEPCGIEKRPSGHQVVFPTGSVWRGESLVVSYGLDDTQIAMTCWTKRDLRSRLVELP